MSQESWKERRDRFIDESWPKKGPCLVPRKEAVTVNSMLLTSHERDYCRCDVQSAYDQGRADALENSISKSEYDALHEEAGKEVMRLHNLAASLAIQIGEMRKIVKNLTLELENVVKRISLEDLYLQDIIRIGYSTFTSESDTSPIEPLASISEDP